MFCLPKTAWPSDLKEALETSTAFVYGHYVRERANRYLIEPTKLQSERSVLVWGRTQDRVVSQKKTNGR